MIIRPYTSQDSPSITSLSDRLFGKGFFDRWTPSEGICLVATNPSVIGLIEFLFKPNGTFLSWIMVDPSQQRTGVGSTLYSEAMSLLPKANFYSTCWKESPSPGIIPFLTNRGWRRSATILNYWHKDSIDNNYKCIRCGKPCLCTAVVMRLDVNIP